MTLSHRRPRLRDAGPTCRRSSTGCTAGTGSRWSAVASDKPGAQALERAAGAGVETARLPGRATTRTAPRATPRSATGSSSARSDLVVLAGYMELLSPEFVRRFRNRIINVHPALLPSFPGLDAVGQALAHGVAGDRGDGPLRRRGRRLGPIILQRPVPVPATRDRAELEDGDPRGRARAAPEAIRLIAAGRVRIDPANPRLVHVDVEHVDGMSSPPTTAGREARPPRTGRSGCAGR